MADPLPTVDVEACVRLLKKCARDYEDSAYACDSPLLARFRTERTEIAAELSALASALPGMGKDSERWRFVAPKLVVQQDRTMAGNVRAFLRVDVGEGRMHKVSPDTHWVRGEQLEAVIDAEIAARAAQPQETSADD